MSDDTYKYYNLLKSSEEQTMNVPKICLLPQSSFADPDSPISPIIPPFSGYKSSNRDSGNFDALFTNSKFNFNHQIKTVHNWFKHLPGSDQTRLLSILLPSVHFDYMSMVVSLAQKQAKFINDEVIDYGSLEEDANNLQSLVALDEEPSVLAVNLLSRLPLLYPYCDQMSSAADNQQQHNHGNNRFAPLAVHQMYARLLTVVFSQDCVDVEDVMAVRQLATVVAHHPNLHPQLQARLVELAVERSLLDERSDAKRPRRPMALSPFGPPGQMTQTQSFSLLVPPFLAANSCLSASASPQSVCSYNSSGFHSGAESSSRRTHPPLSPQSSTSSCAGDDTGTNLLPHSVSCSGTDYDLVLSLQPGNAGPHSLQGQSSIDTPTPSSASSVMLVASKLNVNSSPPPTSTTTTQPALTATNLDNSDSMKTDYNNSFCSYFRDDEAESETNFSLNREETGDGVRNSFAEHGSGMSNVPSWLKSLRLHKYASLFQQLGYYEMLNISEEWLESKNVTKGARNKILVNIRKLESRQSSLRQIECDLVSSGGIAAVRACLHEVRYILTTPIRPFSDDVSGYVVTAASGIDSPPHSISSSNVAEGDLPGQVIRCLSRVCAQLLVSGRKVDEEACGLFMHVVDVILEHDSFTCHHKNLCQSWRGHLEASSRLGYQRKCTWPSTDLPPQQQRSSYRKTSTSVISNSRQRPCTLDQYRSPPSSQFHQLPTQPPSASNQADRPQSIPSHQSALLDLFLQCQVNYPPCTMSTSLERACCPCGHSQIALSAASVSVSLSSASANATNITGSDSSPSGSQDPATAEINRNLDLLAREVTELAIRDPESPET